MISINEAKRIISENLSEKNFIKLNVADCCGYVLAEDVFSQLNLPQADNSAMDGFAFKYSDLQKNKTLTLSKKLAKAGDLPKKLKKSEAIRIYTGGLIPEGADTVAEKEIVSVENNKIIINSVLIKGRNVRYKGEDVKKNDLLISKNTYINPMNFPLITSSGNQYVKVFKKPDISIITTGNELKKAGSKGKIKINQVIDSNYPMIKEMVKKIGIEKIFSLKISDNFEKTVKTLKKALDKSDIIITIGGISAGDFDFVGEAFNKIGAREFFRQIKLKPGKPFSFFKFKNKMIFCLPGNPVSSAVCFDEFVKPAILNCSGIDYNHKYINATFENTFEGKSGRSEILRGIYNLENNSVKLAGTMQNSNILTELAHSNCFIYLDPAGITLKKGDKVKVRII
ncbi:MAG: molybdopterin molybdotransferase MoeA [Candidatus Muiribacteriota bacterium]|jgi:molybdopterin molybdotransferase